MCLRTALFQTGARLGLLGIDLATRRRNRLNAVVDSVADGKLHLSVLQSYGNCPKYIQARGSAPCPCLLVVAAQLHMHELLASF